MSNFTAQNVLETIKMIEEENLDVRTITMGISLLDCIDSDGEKAREKIYNKIMTSAKDLVRVGKEIENEFGIPIVNKRVSVTPISIIAGATDEEDYVEFAKAIEKIKDDVRMYQILSENSKRRIENNLLYSMMKDRLLRNIK